MRQRISSLILCLAALSVVGCGSQAVPTPVVPVTPVAQPAQIDGAATSQTVSLPATPATPKGDDRGLTQHRRGHRDVGSLPILMYHSINTDPKNTLMVAPAVFDAEMKHLKDAGYHAISFADLYDAENGGDPLPAKPVLITFDDGYEDNYVSAYPVLQKYHLKGTIFIITSYVGGKHTLSWDQILEMHRSGVIEIGAHTKTHLDMPTLSKSQQTDEIAGSKAILEQKLGEPVLSFAYPAGRYNDVTVEVTREAGFAFAVTTKPGFASAKQGLLTLDRVRVSGDETPQQFATEFP